MPIPQFTDSGVLPEGIHICTLAELRELFGNFQTSDRRPRLYQKLEAFVLEARASGIIKALVIDGSFVTREPFPNDIDMVAVLRAHHDFRRELLPQEYNVVDRTRVYRTYGLDLFVVEDNSVEYRAVIRFFQRIRLQPTVAKGILRIEL